MTAQKKKRILIVENRMRDFRRFRDLIYESFELGSIEIFPKLDDPSASNNDDFSSWKYIQDKLKEEDSFDWLIEDQTIDVYFIDNCLFGDDDNTGVEIITYIANKGNFNLALLTYDKNNIPEIDQINQLARVLTKYDYDSEIIKYVSEKTGLEIKQNITQPVTPNNVNSVVGNGISLFLKILTIAALLYGILNIGTKSWSVISSTYFEHSKEQNDFKNDTILNLKEEYPVTIQIKEDTIVTEQTGVIKLEKAIPKDSLGTTLIGKMEMNKSEHFQSDEEQESNHSSMLLLDLAENIFLSFLPFFIIFSFMSYYNSYLKYIWLGANSYKNHEEAKKHATAALKLSKALFVSSIVATLIIKIMEKLFSEKKIGYMDLLPHGVLLIILILYYVFLEKESSEEKMK